MNGVDINCNDRLCLACFKIDPKSCKYMPHFIADNYASAIYIPMMETTITVDNINAEFPIIGYVGNLSIRNILNLRRAILSNADIFQADSADITYYKNGYRTLHTITNLYIVRSSNPPSTRIFYIDCNIDCGSYLHVNVAGISKITHPIYLGRRHYLF